MCREYVSNYRCPCNSFSDVRTQTTWGSEDYILASRLQTVIAKAKTEYQIRNINPNPDFEAAKSYATASTFSSIIASKESSVPLNWASKSAGQVVTASDFRQIIDSLSYMSGINVAYDVIIQRSQLVAIQNQINRYQAECRWYCPCNTRYCTCNSVCSCNCRSNCSCNCDNCGNCSNCSCNGNSGGGGGGCLNTSSGGGGGCTHTPSSCSCNSYSAPCAHCAHTVCGGYT